MIINYTARINQFDSLLSKSKNSLSSVFRKSLLTLFIMVGLISTSSQTFGQISYTNGFNGTALGWGTNGFGFTTVATCEGSDALRANQYSAGTAYRFMESPALGSSAGDDVEIKFDYKVINWSGGGATAANFGSIYLEYSINGGISWDTLSTINSSNHIPSISCATITDTIPSNLIPSGSNFKVRYAGSYNAGDYYLYFDAFSAIELTNCLLNPVNITGLSNVTLTSATANITVGASNKYDLKYGAAGFNPNASGTLVPNLTALSYALTGLSCANYDIYVMDSCDMIWNGPAVISYPVPVLDSITSFTPSSFQLNMSLGGSGAYAIQYGPQGFASSGLMADTVNALTALTYTVSNLQPTCGNYDVYFQDTCQKVWVGPFTINSPTPTIDSITNISFTSATTNITAGLSGYYNIEYGQQGFNLGQGNMVNNQNGSSLNLTGLFPGVNYDVYIVDTCSNSWSTPIQFTTQDSFLVYPTQIGSGTSISSNLPIVSCYGYTWSEMIYNQSEIGIGDTIKTLSYYYNGGGSASPSSNQWTIFMGHTTQSGYVSNTSWVTATTMDTVFSGLVTPTSPGWYTITLQNPFVYNNVDNLVIGVHENAPGYSCSMNWRQYSSGTPYRGIYYRSDVTNPSPYTPPIATSATNPLIPQIQLGIGTTPSCNPIASATVIASSTTTADITIQDLNNSGASYEVNYGLEGFAIGSGNNITMASLTGSLTNLTPESKYEAYIRVVCSASDYTNWSGPFAFSTITGDLCATAEVISGLPFFSDTINTASFSDDYSNVAAPCFWNYGDGKDYVFTYTPTVTQRAIVTLNKIGTNFSYGFIISEGCPDTSSNQCIYDGGTFSATSVISPAILFEAGKTYTIVMDDDGTPKNLQLEITPIADEVALNFFVNPVNPVTAGFSSVEVNITNLGGNPLTNVSFGYSVNGVNQAPVTVNTTVAPLSSVSLTIGGNNFPITPTEIIAYISAVNGVADGNQGNDTIDNRFCGPIAGTFTVGGAGATFATIADAASALNCGINGPVVFNIAPGVYNERIELSDIPGSSATNTITFDGGSASTTSITSSSNVDLPTIYFNGADYVTIKNLTVEATFTTDNWAIFLRNQSDYNTIENCIVTMPYTTGFDRTPIAVSASIFSSTSGGNNANHLTIKNNVIEGGYYGISLRGTSTTNRINDFVIENNTIVAYSQGIYSFYVDSVSIKGNNISAHSNPTTHYSIYSYYGVGHTIEANTLTSPDRGLYMFASTTFPANNHRIVNNMISAGSDYGIYMSNIDGVNYLHNTVVGKPAFYASSNNTKNLNVKNNIFASYGDNSFEVNSMDSAQFLGLDYNLYYSQASPSVRMSNSNYGSLLAWQNAHPYANANSVWGDPLLNSPTDLHITLGLLADSAGTPVGVIKDIDGDGRYFLAPDMGADEYTPITSDLQLLSTFDVNTCKNGSDSLYLYVVNKAQTTLDFSTDNFSLTANVSGTAISTGTATISTGTIAAGDTMMVTIHPVALNAIGLYTVDAYLSSTWDIISENDTMSDSYEVSQLLSVTPDSVVFVNAAIDSVEIEAQSPLSTSIVLFSEISQYRTGTGSPSAGWPAYFAGDDYVEISARPGTDLSGYQLAFYSTAGQIGNILTIPSGAMSSPQGTAIISIANGASSPANYFYGAGNNSSGSGTSRGYVLKDPSGAIVDVVGYSGFSAFPASSGVTSADYSGSTPYTGGTSGLTRLTDDSNTAADWGPSSVTAQTPNQLNAGITSLGAGVAGAYWSENGIVVDSAAKTIVGPWTLADNGLHTFIYTLPTPCGLLTDTVVVNVAIVPNEVAVTQIYSPVGGCNIDTTYLQAEVCNNGSATYLNLPVYGSIDGTLYTDTIDSIAPYTCLNIEFPTAIAIKNIDTTLNNVNVWVSVIGDVDVTNDTSGVGPIDFTAPPLPPSTSNDTICGPADVAMLVANASAPVEWYTEAVGGTYLGLGDTILLNGFTGNDTVYAQAGAKIVLPLPSGYCAAGPTTTFDSDITSVYLAGETDTISNPNSCPTSTFVVNNTNMIADLLPGGTYSVDVIFGTCSGTFNSAGSAWIDWNANAVFETSETLGGWSGSPSNTTTQTFTFTVPSNAVVGKTMRMRVMQQESGSLPLNPCGTFSYGNVEDYAILIADPNPCFNGTRTAALVYNNAITIDSTKSTDQTQCALTDGTIDIFGSDANSSIGGAITYSIDGGTTFQSTGAFANLAQNVFGYDVAISDGYCTTNGANIAITKPNAPAAPVMASSISYCAGETLNLLYVDSLNIDSGGQIKWYADVNLSTLLGIDSIAPSQASGTTTYYATQVVAGCEGAASAVDVENFIQVDGPTLANDTIVCLGVPLSISGNTPKLPGKGELYYSESFTTGTGGWTLGSNGPAWTRRSTLSTSSNTGANGGSVNNIPTSGQWYVYLETSTSPGTAILDGPGFTLAGLTNFEFDYHMYGATMGTLSLEIWDGTSWTQEWSISGQQHSSSADPYTTAVVSLENYSGAINARFLGLRGGSYTGDMAVDNIRLYNTQAPTIWALDNQFANVIDTGSSLLALDTIGTTTYYASFIDDNSCRSRTDSIAINKLASPVPPTAASQVYCDGDSITPFAITGSGGTYNVYSDMMLSNVIVSDTTNFTSNLSNPGYASYWFTEVNASGCESPAVMASITINSVPQGANLGADKNYCLGDSILPLSSGNLQGSTTSWYTDATGTVLISTGALNPDTLVGTNTYYAKLSNGLCSGPVDSVKVTINQAPGTPTISGGATYCDGDVLGNLMLSGSGNGFAWYSNSDLTTNIGNADSLMPFGTIDTVTYYGTQSLNGCESANADSVDVIIHSSPVLVSVLDTAASSCATSDGIIQLVASGGDGSYVYSINDGTTLQAGDKFTGLAVGSYSPLIADGNNCSDDAPAVSITAPGQPLTPLVTTTIFTYCYGDALADMGVDTSNSISTSSVYTWYTDVALTVVHLVGDSVQPANTVGTTDYYVTETDGSCEGPSKLVSVTINAIPAAPVTGSNLTFCLGELVGNVSATAVNGSLTWYSDNNLTAVVGSGSSTAAGSVAILPGTYSFYVTETANGCEGVYDSVNVTINSIPTIPNGGIDVVYCDGETLLPLVGSGSGGTVNWYNDPGLSNLEATGDTLALGTLPVGMNDFFFAETNALGCEGNSDKVTVTIKPTPAAPSITNADDYCDYETVQTMTAAGNNGIYTWYTDFAADSVGSTYTTPSVIGTYNLALTETNQYGCESEADSTTVNFFESPTLDSLVLTNVTGGCADSTGAVQLFATGGDGSYTSYASIYGIASMSATGIFNNLTAGTYTDFEVEDGNGCFSDTLNATLTAPGQPSPVELLSVDAAYCFGEAISSLTANDSSASTAGNLEWYTDLGLNNLFVSGDTAVPTTAVGVTTYYVVENNNGCKGPSQAVTVTVNALPTTLVVANVEYCIGDVINDLTANGAGGAYDWYTDMGLTTMLASGSTVTPTLTTVGSETYYVVETDANGCTSIADSTMMTIHALPNVTIATIADICENGGTTSLSSFATPSGITGVWSADSGLAINGTVNPYAMGGAGTYAVVYTYTDANSCVADDTSSITINAEPVVTFSGLSDVCFDQASSTVSGGLPTSGTYTGNGISNGAFDPVTAGLGSSVLTYNYTDGNGCSSSDVDTVMVNALPVPNAGVDQTICFGDIATLMATPSSLAVMDWSTGAQGSSTVVNPTSTTVYTFTGTDNNGCSAIDSITVNVDALPIVTFTSLSSVCVNGAPQPLVTGLPVNGSYSGSGNASTGTFSPGSAGSGLHILTYTYTDPTTLCINSDTTTVVVDTLPNVLFANQSNICDGSAPVNVTGGSPANGIYSGTGVTAAMFDAAAAGGKGTYTLTYSFTDGNGCASSANATIIVDSLPNITWVAFNDLCDNAGVATLTEASPAGGTYTGTGVGGGQFDPASGGQGSYVVSYNFTDANGCSSTSTQSITVNPSPVVAMTYTDSVLCNNITQTTLDAGAGGVVYAWDQDGFPVGTGQQTYVATAAGTYTVEVTNNFTCSNTDSYLVEDVGECISVQTILGDNVSVTYYPNPTSGTLNIDVDGLAGKTINLNIVSMHGQEVYNTTIENAPAQLRDVVDLSGEAQGVYFVKITSGEYHSVQRISVR